MTHESPLSFQNLFTKKLFTYRHRHYSLAQVASLSAGQRETWLSRLFEGKFLWKINLDISLVQKKKNLDLRSDLRICFSVGQN